MGGDDLRRRRALLQLVDRLRPRRGDPDGGARLQLPRRRAARPAGSEVAMSAPPLLAITDLRVAFQARGEIGRASCRERVCQYVSRSVVADSLKKKTNKQPS